MDGQATQPGRSAGSLNPSLFGLASDGVYQASRSPDCWCALTAPFHPYHLRGGFLFYGTFPGVTPAGRYPASCPAKLGLSSRLTARNHLSCSQGTVYHGEMRIVNVKNEEKDLKIDRPYGRMVRRGRWTGPAAPRFMADFVGGLCRKGRRPFGPRVVDCPAGNAYKVSVTGFGFVSSVLHNEEQEPPSLGRGWRRRRRRIGAWIRR